MYLKRSPNSQFFFNQVVFGEQTQSNEQAHQFVLKIGKYPSVEVAAVNYCSEYLPPRWRWSVGICPQTGSWRCTRSWKRRCWRCTAGSDPGFSWSTTSSTFCWSPDDQSYLSPVAEYNNSGESQKSESANIPPVDISISKTSWSVVPTILASQHFWFTTFKSYKPCIKGGVLERKVN